MKAAVLALIGAASHVADANKSRLETRQEGGIISSVGPPHSDGTLEALDPVSRDKIEPQFRPEATREIIRWGPLKVYGNTGQTHSAVDPAGTDFLQIINGICTDCFVLSGTPSLTFANKSTAMLSSGIYNHHITFNDEGTKNGAAGMQCTDLPADAQQAMGSGALSSSGSGGSSSSTVSASSAFPESSGVTMPTNIPASAQAPFIPYSQFIGGGHDDTGVNFAIKNSTLKTGYYVPKGDIMTHFTTLVNYRPEDQDVFLTLDLEYILGRPDGFRDTIMTSISATGCKAVAFMPPANKISSLRSPPVILGTGGYLFDMKGHLHDGGTEINVYINDRLVCTSPAIYGGAEGAIDVNGKKWDTIQGYKLCETPVRVEKGDEVSVEATYDTATHPPRPGSMAGMEMQGENMGLIGLVFARDEAPK